MVTKKEMSETKKTEAAKLSAAETATEVVKPARTARRKAGKEELEKKTAENLAGSEKPLVEAKTAETQTPEKTPEKKEQSEKKTSVRSASTKKETTAKKEAANKKDAAAKKKTTVNKDTAKKPSAKTTAKKETILKKDTVRKGTTTRRGFKVNAVVEHYGRQIEEDVIIANVKKAWTASGKKLKDIKEMELYIKPEENAVYYVVNKTETGAITLYE